MFPKCRLGLGDVCRAAPTLGSESNCRTRSVIPEEERRAGRPPTRAAPKERGRGGWGRKERGRRVKEGLGKGSRTAGSSRKNAPRGQVRDAHPARSRPPLSLRRDARFEAPPLSRLSRNDGKEGEDGGPKRLSQRRPDIPSDSHCGGGTEASKGRDPEDDALRPSTLHFVRLPGRRLLRLVITSQGLLIIY